MIDAVRACERAVARDEALPPIRPSPENSVCASCGSAEVEYLDWVRVNDGLLIDGSAEVPADHHWCPDCEINEAPIVAREYCEEKGHTGTPCAVCGVP